LDADIVRSGDILELYPVWRVGLVLNRVYGELYGIQVDIWADTKEVRSVKEEYSPLAAQWFENTTASVDESPVFFSGAEPNFAMGIMVSATTLSVIGVLAAGLFLKKPRALGRLKPHFLKAWVVLLGFLLLLAVFSPLVATANATTRVATIWGARSSGALGYNSISWRKTDDEINRQGNVTDYIVSNFFTAANGYSGANNIWVNKDVIVSQAYSLRYNYDYVAVVDWDHGVTGYPGQASGYPSVPDNEEHWMFEDDYGTLWGNQTQYFADTEGHTDYSHGVYDIDMYNAFPPAKVHFAFIDACQSAQYLHQGYTASGYPLGMPFAFTHRLVSYASAGYSGTLMSDDGYNRPDTFPQCYIGFPDGSAALDQLISEDGEYGTGPPWYEWIIFFFYKALAFDVSVNYALDWASDMQWQCGTFLDSPLTWPGFTAVWPMDKFEPYGVFENYTGPYSTLAV